MSCCVRVRHKRSRVPRSPDQNTWSNTLNRVTAGRAQQQAYLPLCDRWLIFYDRCLPLKIISGKTFVCDWSPGSYLYVLDWSNQIPQMREPTMPAITMVSPIRPAFTSSPCRTTTICYCPHSTYSSYVMQWVGTYRIVFDDHAVEKCTDAIKTANVQPWGKTDRPDSQSETGLIHEVKEVKYNVQRFI